MRSVINGWREAKPQTMEGNNSTYALVDAFAGPGRYDYVDAQVVDYGQGKMGALWDYLTQSLLRTLVERRVARRPRGRPAEGPASVQLGADQAERVKQVRLAYEYVLRRDHGHASYAEVARRLKISTTTLWRFRNVYGWPPPVGSE